MAGPPAPSLPASPTMRLGWRLVRALRRRIPRESALGRLLRAARAPLGVELESPVDRVLEAFADTRREVFFIQIGSNDAARGDPLRRLVVARGWSGILVEPVPFVFERLVKNYGPRPGLIFENVAVAEEDGIRDFHHLAPAAGGDVPFWYDQIGSFSREHVLKHRARIPDIETRLVTTRVPCLTFESLCRRHGVERIDLVHTDTEGHDARIVRQIDLARYRPAIVLYEHGHLPRPERDACSEHLRSHGYDCIAAGRDTMCIRPADRDADARLARAWRELREA